MGYWVQKTVLRLRTVFFNCCLGFSLWSCGSDPASLPYYNSPDFTPIFTQNPAQRITHTIGAFTMINQHGRRFTEQDISDKIHVANFMFTRCTSICPIMTNHLSKVASTFENDENVALLSFSVTPWMDSVPQLQNFAKSYAITAKNWHLLTGNTSAIYSLARKSYFAEEELGFTKDSTDFLHTERVLLVDQNQHIRGVYNATLPLEITQLIADISLLKREEN